MKRNRRSVMLLALFVLAALVAAACSGSDKSNGNSETEAGKGNNVAQEADAKPVPLVWYMRSSEPVNAASVMEKVNEIIKSEINATLEMKWVEPGDFEQKMQLVMSSNEQYDLVFTSSWSNNYFNNVSRGAYVPLNEMLDQYPDLQALFQPAILDAVRVDGNLYAIPNNQTMTTWGGMVFNKSAAEQYGLDLSGIKSSADLTPFYQRIKDSEPNLIPRQIGNEFLFDPIISAVEGFAVDVETWEVYDKQSRNLEEYQVFREWNQKGFFPPDVATIKDYEPLYKSGQLISAFARQKPGNEAEMLAKYGFEWIDFAPTEPFISRDAVTGALTAISATSANPEKAMELIHLVNTNKDLFNLMTFGIEGQDYEMVSDNHIEKIADTYRVSGWLLGNVFNNYLLPGQPDDIWIETKRLNDTAIVDPIIGFSFNRIPVENEIALLNAVRDEYKKILEAGLDDPEKILNDRTEKMKAAGLDKVIAEIESQLAVWRSGNE